MSEQPQGPGWWLASDGRYYPPEQAPGQPGYGQPGYGQPGYGAPGYGAPGQAQPGPGQPGYAQPGSGYGPPGYGPPGYGPPGSAPPGYGAPPYGSPAYGGPQPFAGPPPRSGGNRTALIIILAVVLVVIVVPVAGTWYFLHWAGNKAADVVGGGQCALISDTAAGQSLGEPISLQKGGGLGGLVSGIIDARVLPGAPSCWGTTTGDGTTGGGVLVRIAVQQGGAQAGYAAEVKKAKGQVVSDNGNGTTVSTEPYYGDQVAGLGDEAFCTTLGLTGTVGVLVRQGDKLVYGAVGIDPKTLAAPDPSASGAAIAMPDGATGCARAQKLARAVLGA